MTRRNRQEPTVVVVQWIMGGLVLLIAMILGYRVFLSLDSKNVILEPSPLPTISQSLRQKDVEPIFNNFIESWNTKNYQRQLADISQDFNSISYDKRTGQPYEDYSYSEYELLKNRLAQEYEWIEVKVTNPQFIPDSNNVNFVRYSQHYNSPKYESWGTNELYFRQENGKIKIFKEVFYRDRFIVK